MRDLQKSKRLEPLNLENGSSVKNSDNFDATDLRF